MINNPDYFKGYNFRAKEIKNKKVWQNWGIAFGINEAAVVVIFASQ